MESLNRKPDLSATKTFKIDDNTEIQVRRVTARTLMQNANTKNMSDTERGLRVMAAKLLVNGQPIVYDDLLDRFNDEELTLIAEKISGDDEKNG